MIFKETLLKGAYLVKPEKLTDERGFFARTWCRNEFLKRGLNPNLVQCNISYNQKKGILRGMHYQVEPYAETKLVRCTMGAIYDVIIDMRRESSTFKQWLSFELTASNRNMLYIPEGFAHGFQTLVDETEVFYQMTEYYHPESARGIQWNDPAIGIKWPLDDVIISDKDRSYSYIM